MASNPNPIEPDAAVRARLGRLAQTPVDTSRVERRVRAMLQEAAPTPAGLVFKLRWRALTAAAAGLIVAAALTVAALSLGGTPAIAAPSELARLHAQTLESDANAITVKSVEEANRVLAGQWHDLPKLPHPQSSQLHACCIHDFMDSKLVCLVLRDGQTPLTLVVGHSSEFRPAQGRTIGRGGHLFRLHQVGALRMAMTQQEGRFVCLMGEVSEARLLEIATRLEF